jgi:catechol 2,3-dioxygenase-like lactoylglutathione lyase family enzyme
MFMRLWTRGWVLFAAGLVLGMVTIKTIEAQQDKGLGLRVNHVGIYVKNLQESVDFYTKTLGMREGFVMRDKSGNPTTVYLQVDKYTFLELAQSNADRPVGINHVGFQTENMSDTVAELRQRGVMVPEPTAVGSGAPHSSINDPNGVRLEMLEFAAGSMQRKAIEAYR